jgi:hypothetical protein
MATAWPVVYGDDYPTLTVPWFKMDSMEFTRTCVLRKAAQWRHEQEYRLISPELGQPSEVIMGDEIGTMPTGSIVGLTIGARMDDQIATDLAKCAMTLSLPVWRAYLSDRQYRLTFGRLTRSA